MKRRILLVLTIAMISSVGMAQHHHPDRGGRDRGRRPPRIECATSEQIGMTLQVLNNQPFDDKKLEIAKLCVVLTRFCTNDLGRMAATFSFDDNRTKFLIFAYDYCEDPENYPSLYDVFEFRNNYDQMIETLYSRKRR